MGKRQTRPNDVRHQNHLLPETEIFIFSIFSLWLSPLSLFYPMSPIAMEVNRFLMQASRQLQYCNL